MKLILKNIPLIMTPFKYHNNQCVKPLLEGQYNKNYSTVVLNNMNLFFTNHYLLWAICVDQKTFKKLVRATSKNIKICIELDQRLPAYDKLMYDENSGAIHPYNIIYAQVVSSGYATGVFKPTPKLVAYINKTFFPLCQDL